MSHEQPTHLDLCSGIGGFSLAFQREGFRTIGHAEVEAFACAVYHHHFPESVCFGPIQHVTRDSVLERCGCLPIVVTGGFPCQPHSHAGKRKGAADDRDLWPECVRVLRVLRPRFAVFENVAGLFTSNGGRFLNRIASDLAEIRFACIWQVVSAADIGAPHRRERIWLICFDELANDHDERGGELNQPVADSSQYPPLGAAAMLADSASNGGHQSDGQGESGFADEADAEWPARPGERQHSWEPTRTISVDDPNSGRVRRTGASWEFGHASQPDKSGFTGDTAGERCGEAWTDSGRPAERVGGTGGELGDAAQSGAHRSVPVTGETRRSESANDGIGQTESALGGLPNGLPAPMVRAWPKVENRVSQLKGYGNAIVPGCAQIFARAIRSQLA